MKQPFSPVYVHSMAEKLSILVSHVMRGHAKAKKTSRPFRRELPSLSEMLFFPILHARDKRELPPLEGLGRAPF